MLYTRSSYIPTRETEVTEAEDALPNDSPSVSEQMSTLIGRQPPCSPGKTFITPGNRAAVLREMAKSLYHAVPEGQTRGKTGVERLLGREIARKSVGRRSEIVPKERSCGKLASKEVQTDPISQAKPSQMDAKGNTEIICAEVAVQTQPPASPHHVSDFESRLQALESLHFPSLSPQRQLIQDLTAQLACERSARLQASTALEKHISEVKRLQNIVQSLQQRAVVSSSEKALRSKQIQVRAK